MSPGNSPHVLVRELRDEFSRMRAHLFEAVEAAGWPERQERGAKGVIRTVTYASESTLVETAMRRAANGGNMTAPGVTSQHVQAARQAVYGPPPEEPAPQAEAASAETTEAEPEAKASTSKK
jgi:hypothetical protein